MKFISVVIPTYERSEFLVNSINSVINQTYPNLEILIVDDNGENNEYRINNIALANRYKSYDNIRFIFPKYNRGGAIARNIGISEAQGDYVAFLDDDDIYLPSKLEEMINAIENEEDNIPEMIYTWTKSSDNEFYTKVYNGNPIYELFRDDCLAATSQWLFSKQALLEVEGFDNVPAKQDSILTYKLLRKGYNVKCVPKILSIYNSHDGSRISNNGKKNEGEEILYNKYLDSKYLFTKGQRRVIEFNFHSRFFKYTFQSREFWKVLKNFYFMLKIDTASSIKFLLRNGHFSL